MAHIFGAQRKNVGCCLCDAGEGKPECPMKLMASMEVLRSGKERNGV